MVMLDPNDFVGVTFWIISVAMVASTAFFFVEAGNMTSHWRTSVIVAGLVTSNCCGSLLLHESSMGGFR